MSADVIPDNWPLRSHSRIVEAGDMHWHIQRCGRGPRCLLVHGTGASSHSWAGLIRALDETFELLAVDLPGHGFSGLPGGDGMSLPGMASRLGDLLGTLAFRPTLAIGHSAGAAVLARMCLDRQIAPCGLVSINGALLALPGLTGHFFSASARILAAIPVVPAWVSGYGGRRAFTARMIRSTGSTLPEQDIECYRYLVSRPAHVAAALKMMASWDLKALEADLPGLSLPVHLIACEGDRTVPPEQARRLLDLLPDACLHTVPGLGHLGHEEDPAQFARRLRQIFDRCQTAG